MENRAKPEAKSGKSGGKPRKTGGNQDKTSLNGDFEGKWVKRPQKEECSIEELNQKITQPTSCIPRELINAVNENHLSP